MSLRRSFERKEKEGTRTNVLTTFIRTKKERKKQQRMSLRRSFEDERKRKEQQQTSWRRLFDQRKKGRNNKGCLDDVHSKEENTKNGRNNSERLIGTTNVGRRRFTKKGRFEGNNKWRRTNDTVDRLFLWKEMIATRTSERWQRSFGRGNQIIIKEERI